MCTVCILCERCCNYIHSIVKVLRIKRNIIIVDRELICNFYDRIMKNIEKDCKEEKVFLSI